MVESIGLQMRYLSEGTTFKAGLARQHVCPREPVKRSEPEGLVQGGSAENFNRQMRALSVGENLGTSEPETCCLCLEDGDCLFGFNNLERSPSRVT